MTKKETVELITYIGSNYESILNKTKEQLEMMVELWYDCLKDLDYEIVKQALKKTILESKYMPTIAEIRQNAIQMITPRRKTGIEAWSDAYKLICRGTTVTQKEFDNLEPNIKKFFGSVSQLKDYATNAETNMDVVRSNFLKSYDILEQRNKEIDLMLPETKARLEQLQNSFVKQLAEG